MSSMTAKELNSISDWIKKLPPEQRKKVYLALFSLVALWILTIWGVMQLAPSVWHSRAISYDCSRWTHVLSEFVDGCSTDEWGRYIREFECTLTYGSIIKTSDIGKNVKFVTPNSEPAKELQKNHILNFNDSRLRGIFFEEDKVLSYNNDELRVHPYIICYNHSAYIAFVPTKQN